MSTRDLTSDEIEKVANQAIPDIIKELVMVKNTYTSLYDKSKIPTDLKVKIACIDKLSKIWNFEMSKLETKLKYQSLKTSDYNDTISGKKFNEEPSTPNNKEDSDGDSVSDVDYDEFMQDDVQRTLDASIIELDIARSSKGFRLQRKPVFVIDE
jgi:hypothetical protein